MVDDDLRFGDVDNAGGQKTDSENMIQKAINTAIQLIVLVVVLYVLWEVAASLLPLI